MPQYKGTRAECDALAVVLDKVDGGPKRGQHVGGGRHVNMPETWDGSGSVPPGWTSNKGSVRIDPSDASAYLVDADDGQLDAGKTQQLNAAEKALLSAAFAAKAQMAGK